MENKPINVLMLMSGGVDSSVAAALLKEQGYQVTGVIMKIWGGEPLSREGHHHGCYGPDEAGDIEDARQVAQILKIPFKVIDLTSEYKSVVLDYFREEYLSGRTPNPCVRCNYRIKFKALVDKSRESGVNFDFIASGHYARVELNPTRNRYLLMKARDLTKDQSYFLTFLSQEQLSHLIFPLSNYSKSEVRNIATRFGLPVAAKPDSQNFVCGDYSSMIKTETQPGPIIDKQGIFLGQHRGIEFYTIGQRKGLEISAKEPLYVTAIDPMRNAVLVGKRADIYQSEFKVTNINWIAIENLDRPRLLKVKIRSSHKEAEALVNPMGKESVQVKFDEPQMAIAPGQAAVFYEEDIVVGGGIIC